ncbi:hypothetical protein HI921_14705 [Enterococcus mundtii]|uniref:Bacterial repeat domain-containing protein n=1 Tax=Enterococcus mundtii TaxID=53346 RepID=A0A848MZM9_ENTMU|nr:hypothetical protein [Enterococcus mundtii]
MSFRKQAAFVGAIILFFQVVPLSLIHTYAETEDSVDPQLVDTFRSHQPEYLQLNQPMDPSEQKIEAVQEFSFVDKTFRTTVGQPVLLRFTSTLPANEVLVRIPAQGQIVEEEISNEQLIQHSHGEYWLLKTSNQQTDFVLPVVFETAGQYFLTVDHDADHFYLEVEEEDPQQTMSEFSPAAQPVVTAEQNLVISEELISAENERLLEETLNPATRSTSTVRNWSQFRSAWNSSRTSEIIFGDNFDYSSSITGSSLNARSTNISIVGSGRWISFGTSSNFLEMNGSANLSIHSLEFFPGNGSGGRVIRHNGSGLVDANNLIAESSFGSFPLVEAQNLTLSNSFRLRSWSSSPISIVRGGTLTITTTASGVITGDYRRNPSIGTKPISSNVSSRIILNTNRLTMGTNLETPRSSWDQVNVTLSGVNGSQVVSGHSDPNDFTDRYTQLFNESWYSSLIFNGRGSEFEPPIQTGTVTAEYVDIEGNELAQSESITGNVGTSYTTQSKDIDGWTLIEVPSNASGLFTQEPITVRYVYQRKKWSLSLQANPTLGGSPSSDNETLSEKETTTIRANPNDEYFFVKWEIVSGTNAKIANETAETTIFTMGNEDTTIRAVYEMKTILPVDPLDPEVEVAPENKPELPEAQGSLSIDFVSSFNFGSQALSIHDQMYYAQPQRLLTGDGTVNERPNYVQISDRRPVSERNGWQLSVTQNGQFRNESGHELIGS